VPVSRLAASDCPAPACRPRVLFIPLTRSECPTVGWDARPVRPRLLDRLLGLFNARRCGGATPVCDDVWCSPNDWKLQPMTAPVPATANPPMTPPTPSNIKPISTPQSGWISKPAQPASQQPFTNP